MVKSKKNEIEDLWDSEVSSCSETDHSLWPTPDHVDKVAEEVIYREVPGI